MTDTDVTICVAFQRRQAWAFAEVIKQLQRRNLGPADLNLTDPRQPDEQSDAEAALDRLQCVLTRAGFDTR
jgi:hypothetical protein